MQAATGVIELDASDGEMSEGDEATTANGGPHAEGDSSPATSAPSPSPSPAPAPAQAAASVEKSAKGASRVEKGKRKRGPEPPPEDDGALQGGTLVVCPTMVLHQWAREAASKLQRSAGAN